MPVSKYHKLLNSDLPYMKTELHSSKIMEIGITSLLIISSSDDIKKSEFHIIDNIHVKGGLYKKSVWV